jgi:hypothetical protein
MENRYTPWIYPVRFNYGTRSGDLDAVILLYIAEKGKAKH